MNEPKQTATRDSKMIHFAPMRLLLLAALLPALHASTINTTGECPSSITSPSSLTYTIPETSGCNVGGTITVLQSQLHTSVSFNVGVGTGSGGLNVSSAFSGPDLTILVGGGGLGYLDITYTDTVDLGPLYELEGVSGHAGTMDFNVNCNFYCPLDETVTYSTGPIPVSTGEQIPIQGDIYLSAGMSDGNLQGTISVTASVAITESWAADTEVVAESVPEPSVFWFGVALMGGVVVRKRRKE